MSKETFSQLGSYPLLALLVRAIKYLGIYRHEALPNFGQAAIVPAKGALMVDLSIRRAIDLRLPASSNNQIGGLIRHALNASPNGRHRLPLFATFLQAV